MRDVDRIAEPFTAHLRDKAGELAGRRPQAALLLLRDEGLLDVVSRCHPDTLRQLRWANGKIKEPSTQILVS
ncbi:hypothetical protein ABZY45_25215 [Streptomyces sp. NPDC006516]|uniref:hypothetical protein n=1 Tax=Streptomyces sp. NPDC006516 TaxID=3154309 RepID=UPI0033AF9295